jgi:hypothetical protein
MSNGRDSNDEGGFVDRSSKDGSSGDEAGRPSSPSSPSNGPLSGVVEALISECMDHFGCSRGEALSRLVDAAEEVRWARYEVNARAFGVLGANWLENETMRPHAYLRPLRGRS